MASIGFGERNKTQKIMEHSKGNWQLGKNSNGENVYGAVVTDDGDGFNPSTGHSDIEHYGGYLICESVMKEADRRLISAAPDMLIALNTAKQQIEEMRKAIDSSDSVFYLGRSTQLTLEIIEKAINKVKGL